MEGMDRLELEVAHGNDVPFGWLLVAGRRHPFQGYAELVSEVERARSDDTTTDGGDRT
jgi:hypothetical protein